MRRIACLVAVLLVSWSDLGAQAERSDSDYAQNGRCIAKRCLVNTPVLNAAFSADATTTWQPPASTGRPTLRATARYYRDSAGRLRIEQGFIGSSGPAQMIILAPKPGSRTTYLLDPVARTHSPALRGMTQMMVGDGGYNQFVLATSKTRFIAFFVTPGQDEATGSAAEEPLGERMMAGMTVTGTRVATYRPGPTGNGHAERWLSPELGLLVYTRSEDSYFGILEYQLTNISRSEPAAELFDVPQQYAETAPEFPLTWEAPYHPQRTKTK